MKIATTKPCFQGELMIRRIDKLPSGLKAVQPDGGVWIIGHSETGHHHVIDRPKAEVFEPADDSFVAFIKALDDAELKHLRDFDTHEPIKLEKGGVYEVRRQREWTPEGFRRAAD